jgi:hypothetical protein
MHMYFLVFKAHKLYSDDVCFHSFSSSYFVPDLAIGVFWTLDLQSLLFVGLIFLSHDTIKDR